MISDQVAGVFFWELRTQIAYALRSWQDAQESLLHRTVDDFWYSTGAFLSASIAVTNILWPSPRAGKVALARATGLRARLGAGADAPSGLRDVRNGFEHFDERVDDWAASSSSQTFVDTNVGPPGMISGMDPGDVARHFDPTTGVLGVFGKTTSVPQVIAELESLLHATPPR